MNKQKPITECPLCKKQLSQQEIQVMKTYGFSTCVTCRAKQEAMRGGDKK